MSYQAFDPEMFGRKTELVFGKHSGAGGMNHFLRSKGIFLAKEQLTEAMVKMKDAARRAKRAFDYEEAAMMLNASLNDSK